MLAQKLISRTAGRPLIRTLLVQQHGLLRTNRLTTPLTHLSNFQTQNQQFRWRENTHLGQVPNLIGCQSRGFGTSDQPKENNTNEPIEEKKLSLFQKFKQMYKEYWYVLLPVHCATSAVWVGCFYYIVRSGVDVPSLLQTLHVPDKALEFIKNNSSTGHLAVVYALYKVATPARYFVTVGGTTFAINKLKKLGYIKPMPNREQLKEMYQERRDNFKENISERKENFMQKFQSKKE
ncbi:protein FAM210A [Neocloeon triangulifer]|uniref:protein FAM210A n=1 Tax=Neocloeon triangulifer TaxID=2078957 RepID=UPI00286F2DF6|nr:protein FAM210A [Neocloeon triangulifer]